MKSKSKKLLQQYPAALEKKNGFDIMQLVSLFDACFCKRNLEVVAVKHAKILCTPLVKTKFQVRVRK